MTKLKKISSLYCERLMRTTAAIFVLAIIIIFFSASVFVQAQTEALFNRNNSKAAELVGDQIVFTLEKYLGALANEVDVDKKDSSDYLSSCIEDEEFVQLSIMDKNGVVKSSTDMDFVGYNIRTNPQFKGFYPLLSGKISSFYDKSLIPNPLNEKENYNYSACTLEDGSILLAALTAENFQSYLVFYLYNLSRFDAIGKDGFTTLTFVEDDAVTVFPSDIELSGFDELGIKLSELKSENQGKIKTAKIKGTEYFYSFVLIDTCALISFLPVDEVYSSWFVILTTVTLALVVLLAAVFLRVNRLNKKLIVNNIQRVNAELAEITDGKLNTVVDVRDNIEFAQLSDDINATVNTLKGYIEREAGRIDEELSFAREIQLSALPDVFPPFENRSEIDVFASMDAAKVVGGDFYDFFFTGENNLAFLVADVSDKGIPAALFMMKAKSVIKSLAQSGREVNEVLYLANNILCEGNEKNMFVTLWLGVLNTETGELSFANAGHCLPVVKNSEGVGFLDGETNIPLGIMDGIDYKKGSAVLKEDDVIFLYTDGVTEAENTSETLYGEENLLNDLKKIEHGCTSQKLCEEFRKSLSDFTLKAPQSDDITMLSLAFKGKKK